MLIFDSFKNEDDARRFAADVTAKHGLATTFCSSQEEADSHDPFPFQLTPPIVLVERPDLDAPDHEAKEDAVEKLVEDYGGNFAGT